VDRSHAPHRQHREQRQVEPVFQDRLQHWTRAEPVRRRAAGSGAPVSPYSAKLWCRLPACCSNGRIDARTTIQSLLVKRMSADG
jgi:hypothetical protein